MLLAEPTVHNNTEKWIEKVTKDKNRVRSYDKKERVVQPQAVIERIGELTKGDAIVVTDVGQHQMWTAQYYPYQNERQLVTSGGRGTMGFGVPAAIGAKIANPEKEVVLFVGDGGFQMTNQELAILNIYKVPIKVVMLNNHSLGMVRQWQEAFYDGRTSESVFDSLPDVSRITIIIDVVSHDEVEQIIKQLNRQVDVIRVRDITDKPHLEREVILVKVSAPAEKRAEILAIIQPFRATVVDVAPSSITVQMTGNAEKSEALIRVIRPYGIKNIARTGATGFTRD